LVGAHLVFSRRAVGLECRGSERIVHLAGGGQVAAKAVIVATGIAWRRLGVPRLEALIGSGVFYGAAGTEAKAMEGRDVFVVGAGNSAGGRACAGGRGMTMESPFRIRAPARGRRSSANLLYHHLKKKLRPGA
jgi:hypothetical protein